MQMGVAHNITAVIPSRDSRDTSWEPSNSHWTPASLTARLIAFYLPQYHPIPENDQWWGKGFTEWTNVTGARPFFKDHYQPRLPADLGFYDLRVPEVREAQAELAKQYGIHGFCYWHYWFHGQRLLNRPFDEVLASGRPNFPFCLAWANESWSRSWLGDNRDILIEQTYSEEDYKAHAQWLAKAFADPRYIQVDGRPLFLVYRPGRLPDTQRFTETFRREITRLGLPEPYLVGINAHSMRTDMRNLGFDMTEHHEPQLGVLPGAFSPSPAGRPGGKMLAKLLGRAKVYSYDEARALMDAIRPEHPHFPGYFFGWDNTPRRGKDAIVVTDADPEAITSSLRQLIARVQEKPDDHQIIFLNAWNEWAEGMYLEPDQRRGRSRLEAIQAALSSVDLPAPSRSQLAAPHFANGRFRMPEGLGKVDTGA